ncbi:DUF637 domain-containing protein [Shewanella surugensis]|uniref:DUF637 domain-containing protein n=1 Tax=Shewanella surugensis TaxID=212020 RepID=A0ABT0LB12_9GAMM|nr:DUF637 domain-containing protein [Shewanella surugensis]MCL1124555.1 DUF637 domain-containing protein [Shewanella surugensis]
MKHTNQISQTLVSQTPEAPLWQKMTSYLLTFVMLFQITLPMTAQAANLISDSFIQSEVNANGQYERVSNSQYQFEKAYYVDDVISHVTQNIATFQQKLRTFRKSALPTPLMIPIMNDGITIILPLYPLAKQIGDGFVQSRFIRSQIFNALNRNLISDAYTTESIQINALYNNSYTFSGTSSAKLGDSLTQAQVNSFGQNLIWPELRSINGEQVLVPVVHFTDASLDALILEGHRVEFLGDEAQFNSITVNAGTIFTNRNTFINTAGDFNVNQNAKVVSSGDLNLLVGGTLQILSGQLTAQDSVNIIANQYQQKTLVHRFATRFEQGTRLGTIASVNAINGNVSIRSYSDIVVQGGTIDGNNIVLNADGNIMLLSQQTSYVRNENVGGYDESTSIVSHTASRLSASDSIYLMASGVIQINASTLTADSGVLQLLAQQGIYITNEFDEFNKNRQGTVGIVTITEQEFQTIAIQSALEAGKGVLIASDFGDITLRATEITSGDGTQINAYNGAVNLLLAKEQDHYFVNRVTEGFWRIKTETQTDTVDTAVYNRIIGGVKVQATHGVTLELGQSEDVTLDEMMAQFSATDDLSWMADLYQDPELTQNVELIYQELVNIHEYDKTSSLSPAAMAIIAIAMAVVMGPAGFAAIGAGGGIAVGGATMTAALQAGALALATQTAMSFANGNNLIETAKAMHSSETVKTVAMAMATAGALSALPDLGPFTAAKDASEAAQNAVAVGNQVVQMTVRSAVSAGISTIAEGGDFGEFNDVFVQTLQTAAINAIGEELAGEIGDASKSGDINQAVRYIAHASLGCVIGVASASATGSDSDFNCASGAGGAVVGEIIADSFKEYNNLDEFEEAIGKEEEAIKKALGVDNIDPNNLTNDQLEILFANQTSLESLDTAQRYLQDMKAQGTDLAKLGAGLAAFIAGGEVNIAANAGENAAENNGLFFLYAFQAAVILWKAYDYYQTVDSVYDFGSKLNAINNSDTLTEAQKETKRNELIIDAAGELAVGLVIGKTAADSLKGLADAAKKTEVGSNLETQLNALIDAFSNKQDFAIAGFGRLVDPSDAKHFTQSGYSVDAKIHGTDLPKSKIPEGEYTPEQLTILNALNSSHTLTRHGPHVTDEHLKLRATTGRLPDTGKRVDVPAISSKFNDKESLLEATELVAPGTPAFMEAFIVRDRTKESFSFSISTGKSMGYGYQNETGGFVSAKSMKGVTLGEPRLVDSLTYVKVSYKYNKASDSWHMNTMYPSNK